MSFKSNKMLVLALLMFLVSLPKHFFAQTQTAEESPAVKISGRVQMMTDTSFEDAGGLEGVSGDYRKNIPNFVFQRFFINADAQVLPWLKGVASIGPGVGLSEASFTITMDQSLKITGGWFGNSLGREISTSGKFLMNEAPEGLRFNEDDLLGLRVHGSLMEDQFSYQLFVGNAYTGGLPTKSNHFLPSARTGLKLQYDFLQPWRHNREQFYEDTNVSVAAYVDYSPVLASRVGSLFEERLLKELMDPRLAASLGGNLSSTLPNPYAQKDFIAAGGSLAGTFSIFTIQLEGRIKFAKTVNFAGDTISGTDYTPQYAMLTDIVTTLYNDDDWALANVLRFQYFNKPAGSRSRDYDTNAATFMQGGALGSASDNLTAAQRQSATLMATAQTMQRAARTMTQGGYDSTLSGLFKSGSSGLSMETKEKIMRLGIGFPVYFKQHTFKVIPECIIDLDRKRYTGDTSQDMTKNIVIRLGATLNF